MYSTRTQPMIYCSTISLIDFINNKSFLCTAVTNYEILVTKKSIDKTQCAWKSRHIII